MLLLLLLVLAPGVCAAIEVREIPANPSAGFHWPYLLVVPDKPVLPTFLVVEPNNSSTGSDDYEFHLQMARKGILRSASHPGFQQLPYLMPVFPRPRANWKYYTHALDRDTLEWREPGMERIDVQLIAMVEDARRRLAAENISVAKKFFLWGYSAGGAFTIRFSVLHPERVQAASVGGCSVPTIPSAKINGHSARYPIGVADLKQLTGRKFDAEAFRRVPIQIFRGAADDNDEVAFADGYDETDRNFIHRNLGPPPPNQRYPAIEALYKHAAPHVKFTVEPGVKHNDALTRKETPAFFEQHRR